MVTYAIDYPHIIRMLIALGIVIVGIILARIVARWVLLLMRKKYGADIQKPVLTQASFYIVLSVALFIALGYFQITFALPIPAILDFLSSTGVVLVLLTAIAFALASGIILLLKHLFEMQGLLGLIRSYDHEDIYRLGMLLIHVLLFLLILGFLLQVNHFSISFLSQLFRSIVFPLFIFALVILVFAVKDMVTNIAWGLYFKKSKTLSHGQYISLAGAESKIVSFSSIGVLLKNDEHSQEFYPYQKLAKGFRLYKAKHTFETLEELKSKFVTQHPSYCGPASVAMVLRIFGFEFTQEEIADMAKTVVPKTGEPGGTKPEDLIATTKKLTMNTVHGVWIDADHISNLAQEVKSWLHDGGLVIVDYKKSFLFPNALKAHYSLCVGINGDELLILDPSSKSGGIYYVDHRQIYAGMDTYSEFLQGKRGYLVLAKDGSPAFERIASGMIYLQASHYNKISKTIRKNIVNLQQSIEKIDQVFPQSVLALFRKKKEKVSRIWKPASK